MEAAALSPSNLLVKPLRLKSSQNRSGMAVINLRSDDIFSTRACFSLANHPLESVKRNLGFSVRHSSQCWSRRFSVYCSDQLQSSCINEETISLQPSSLELSPSVPEAGTHLLHSHGCDSHNASQAAPKKFKNKFLTFVRLGSVINSAAESFFKSEIRRRLFVTAVLVLASRVGYFIPLPGFDRRLIPQDYLSFVSGSVDELGDFSAELKLSLFQLGISPQIGASILMQVLCHVVPSLMKLRKEGLDGHEKIKGYIWWISLGFAILEAVILACYSLPYSVYASSHRFKHVMVTSSLLVFGAMTMTWICDKISESGFGHGSSLILCAGILTGYTDTLHKMLFQLSGNAVSWWPSIIAVLGIFTVFTMGAVLITEGCRKIKLQYYAFKLASAARDDSPITEVEPYIPFNINPQGMQPVLATTYLLAFPSILASLLGSPFWEHVKEILNPETSIGAEPWVFYSIYAFFVFLFNIFDIANLPKEIADYLTKMGARIPNVKPGRATIEYLTKIQASTRFWGGLLLSILATTSTFLDHYLRRINEGFAIGFTSVLIIDKPIFPMYFKTYVGGLNNRTEEILSSIQCNADLKQGFKAVWCLMSILSPVCSINKCILAIDHQFFLFINYWSILLRKLLTQRSESHLFEELKSLGAPLSIIHTLRWGLLDNLLEVYMI